MAKIIEYLALRDQGLQASMAVDDMAFFPSKGEGGVDVPIEEAFLRAHLGKVLEGIVREPVVEGGLVRTDGFVEFHCDLARVERRGVSLAVPAIGKALSGQGIQFILRFRYQFDRRPWWTDQSLLLPHERA